MRAVAVALVVLFHAEIPGFGGGYVGVDVFFVISGFLISTHLLIELDQRGHIRYGAFYARRVRRLLPAALTVVVATVAAAAYWVSPLQFGYVVKDAIAATFYVPNVLFAYRATDYLADVAAAESGDFRVEQHDEGHRDRAHALNVETFLLFVSATERRRFHCDPPGSWAWGKLSLGRQFDAR
ncbi:hypothetical protein A5630_22920 [Mycolicibacterium mucogenicum]|uniref:Acyltransferase 3 domain-containing protein n=1 Tax=Mycolicibacterium mucogenicum TaxID=56689 RepID=A0A1A3H0Y0_MYCMU|nr:acyltransferase [Mycolicibacterium mucogenicum]OBJ41298.1 hypothetical protein A5630_22920 [Mycolicibacterium mucogenicum]